MATPMATQPQPPRPEARTSSKCIMQTARGTHQFEVSGNSLQPGNSVSKPFITSAAFDVGGYRWRLRFYPSYKDDYEGAQADEYVSLYLELLSETAQVVALFDFRFVDQDTGSSRSIFCTTVETRTVFSTVDVRKNWGAPKLMKRSDLYASSYLRDDRLLIECDVTVINETRAQLEPDMAHVELPPLELSLHLAKLLETKEGADVTFTVQGQEFPAHRVVLAARSTVFKEVVYGPVGDDNGQCISVEHMQPAIFSALLHFVYTDSLPSMEYLDDEESIEFAKHLLVAADRYAVERLKLICEVILCKGLDVQSVDAMLTMSYQYNCRKLKDACRRYIHPSE